MRNNTPFNILASFAYLYNNKEFCDWVFGLHKDRVANVMIDSGAFTKHNASLDRSWLTVDSYCKFLEKYGELCEKYVMLDVVGKDIESKRNYETMCRRGFKPMFVLTMFDTDWDYLNSTLKTNTDICVAGGVTTKGSWMTKRFQDVYRHTHGKARSHGLGYVTFPKIFQVPIVSADSSSWKQAALCFGNCNYFTNRGVKGCSIKNIRVMGGKTIDTGLRKALQELEITPALFSNKEYHKGNLSIESMLSCHAYVQYQKYAIRHNRQLFLAVSNAMDVKKLNYFYNTKELNYERYRKVLRDS